MLYNITLGVWSQGQPKLFTVLETPPVIIPFNIKSWELHCVFQITLGEEPGMLIVDNGLQDPIELFSRDRNMIAAMFSKASLKKMGRGQRFETKKLHFYKQLKASLHHAERDPILLTIDRHNLLNSVSHYH